MATQDFILAKIHAAFDHLDRDGDGVLTEEDHVIMGRAVAGGLGHTADSPEEDAIIAAYLGIWRDLHLPMDTDGDGRISRDEFVAATAGLLTDPDTADKVLGTLADRVLDIADRDQDDRITVAEYTAFIRGHAPGLTPTQVHEAFGHLDGDGDGRVSRAELRRTVIEYFTSPDPEAPGNWYFGSPPALV
jgi:Ca2+-binding EF-hand superfamily protein